MSAWVIFRRARSLFFGMCQSFLTTLSSLGRLFVAFLVLGFLTWATLFAVFLYHEWSHFSRFQSASSLNERASLILTVRGRDCCRRPGVALCFHRGPSVFDVRCPNVCEIFPLLTPIHRAVVLFRFWWEVARILALLVVHTGKPPSTKPRNGLTCQVGGSVLFMRYSPRLPCRGFGE